LAGFREGATLTDKSAWFEESLWNVGAKIRSAHEWEEALITLKEALYTALPRENPPGTFYQVDQFGRRVGPRYRQDGKDSRGRHKQRPIFEALIYRLLDLTKGKLTFDKNGPSGSLVDVLEELRPQLPHDVIPQALPASTISRRVTAWRRRPKRNRTKKSRTSS
jgi:hypothetical protein